MEHKNLVGVILAGGKGTRMLPFSEKYPKPILPIANKPLLAYQLQYMKELGIQEVLIVLGHLGFEIVKLLGNGEQFGVKIQYIDQGETLGIAHALGKLEACLNSPFLLFLGDISFITNNISSMVTMFFAEELGGVLAVKEEFDPEAIKRNFSVVLGADNLVKRVIEKPRYVATTNRLKGCGFYLFGMCIFDAIRRTPRTAMRDEYEITDAIQILIDDGYHVKVAPVVTADMNLSYPYDLLKCNLAQLQFMKKGELIGSNCRIHPRAQIVNSVIGNNAVIENPIEIRDSLVFPNTVITSTANLSRVIVTEYHIVDCRDYSL